MTFLLDRRRPRGENGTAIDFRISRPATSQRVACLMKWLITRFNDRSSFFALLLKPPSSSITIPTYDMSPTLPYPVRKRRVDGDVFFVSVESSLSFTHPIDSLLLSSPSVHQEYERFLGISAFLFGRNLHDRESRWPENRLSETFVFSRDYGWVGDAHGDLQSLLCCSVE